MLNSGILSGPEDHVVAPGDLVYFNCHVRGINFLWYINGNIVYIAQRMDYRPRGFEFIDVSITDNEYNNTIIVRAYQFNNNTNIKCVVTRQGQPGDVRNGTLIIASETCTYTLHNNCFGMQTILIVH